MKLKEVVENLAGVATKITKLGIQEEVHHPKLVETSTALDLRAIGLAVAQKDLKDDVVIVPDSGEGNKDVSVYLVDNELTRKVVEVRYGKLLGEKGLKPIIRTKTIKRGGQDVVVLHVPLLDAQVVLTHTDLGTQVPGLYCGKTLDKRAGDYLTCGEEIREHYAKYVLGEEPSLHDQERLENSKTAGGRVANVTENAVKAVKTYTPIVARSTAKFDKELHQELKEATKQIGKEGLDLLGDVSSELYEVSQEAIKVGDEKQVDLIANVIAGLTVFGLGGKNK